ncbi:MAG: phytanoyl-CoA dioxygenase family protein [Rhodospirillales bacterium]|nr:phytanoyl-CoA dioxygenase family protein [Alphaproteobacteria bacterium]MBL6948498.1 phytanoyl-CoA dioxygenase family protein [Rhodospirillales bacterium]
MLSTPVLSDEQIDTFKNDGYLVLRQAFDAEEMTRIETWARELVALPEETGKHWVYHEKSLKGDDADLISRIENIAPFHDGFAELSSVLKAPVAQLLGEKSALFKEKVNFKMPGGDGFKPHQDSQAGWDEYADFFISVLVSIDEATEENGCLQMCGGHHQRGLFKSWEPLTDEDMAGMDFVLCPTEPGDVVFFDCFAPHASEPNMTESTRRIYYATYNRASAGDHMAQYYADKHKSFPPDIDRDPAKEYVFRV